MTEPVVAPWRVFRGLVEQDAWRGEGCRVGREGRRLKGVHILWDLSMGRQETQKVPATKHVVGLTLWHVGNILREGKLFKKDLTWNFQHGLHRFLKCSSLSQRFIRRYGTVQCTVCLEFRRAAAHIPK